MNPVVSAGDIEREIPPMRWIGTCGMPVRLRITTMFATL